MIQTNSYEERSKLLQIFRYIQALNQLRHPPQKEINDQPWILWFHDLPNHPCIRRGVVRATTSNFDEDDSAMVDDFILKVSRPKLTEPPNPPKEIIPWLKDGWQNIDAAVDINQTIRTGASNQLQNLNFNDDPQRKRLLEEWKAQRDRWVDNERPSRRTMDIFEKLYALQSDFERESERFELIVGDGLLQWKTESIHHPVLLLHLQLRFNPEIAEFTLIETGQSTELYTAMLQTVADIKATQIAKIREELEQSDYHPLGGEETARFMKRFVIQLSPHGELLESGILKNNQIPSITRDPVLFLRPRILGISTALEAILDSLPAKDKLPYSLTSLAGITTNPNEKRDRIPSTSIKDSPNGEDETILLSKPANAEQLEIARRLEKYGAVLVQGPPGTGKTHTIANLVGHLLAQGKTVLVTSEKPKALRVLKEKVVEALQPLCVSMLEDDSRKEMESTIDAISERLASTDADKLEREAEVLAQRRIELLRLLRETRHQLAEARGSEYRAIIVAGESYSPSEAARYITQNKSVVGWIPAPATQGIPLPLSIQELLELYSSNTKVTSKDEQELSHFLPDSAKLISPIDFEQLVNTQAHLLKYDLNYRRDLWFIADQNHFPEEIQQLHKYLIQEIERLRNLTPWHFAAIAAGREGGAYSQVWFDLLKEIEYVYNLAAEAQLWLVKYDPV
ncbi:MAG TPA: AAA domain-containing protein, partial [Ktedonobacteraceae bacterium]